MNFFVNRDSNFSDEWIKQTTLVVVVQCVTFKCLGDPVEPEEWFVGVVWGNSTHWGLSHQHQGRCACTLQTTWPYRSAVQVYHGCKCFTLFRRCNLKILKCVSSTRVDSGYWYAQATQESRQWWIHPGPETKGTSGPLKWTLSQQKLKISFLFFPGGASSEE